MTPKKNVCLFFNLLPGELRNQIFDLCIYDYFDATKNVHSDLSSELPTAYNLTVLPRWSGKPSIRIGGKEIGHFPLLLVNKQMFEESSCRIYSKVGEICIGPYNLQYINEDPNIRWECAYKLLRPRLHQLQHVKTVTVTLPWARTEFLHSTWKSMGYQRVERTRPHHTSSVVTGLVEFLKTLTSLSLLSVVIIAESLDPPNFEPLLPFFTLCDTKFEFKRPHTYYESFDISHLSHWTRAWDDCLLHITTAPIEETSRS